MRPLRGSGLPPPARLRGGVIIKKAGAMTFIVCFCVCVFNIYTYIIILKHTIRIFKLLEIGNIKESN